MEEKLLQMKSLVERLNQASDSYYNGKGELMTDYESVSYTHLTLPTIA